MSNDAPVEEPNAPEGQQDTKGNAEDDSVPKKPRSGAVLWAKLREKHRESRKKKKGLRVQWHKLLDDENMKAPPTWEERFFVLLSFRKRYGHCDVPPDFKVQWLVAWVNQQRAEYDLYMCSDPRTPMTEEQVRLLTDAGFDWEGQPHITFTSGKVAIAFGANGWEQTGDGEEELREARVKIHDQHERAKALVSQLKDCKTELKALKEGKENVSKQALEDLHAENIVLREANAKLLENLAIARLDEMKSHEGYLRQKLQIRGYKAELLRCYNLMRNSSVDPVPPEILEHDAQAKDEDDAKVAS